MQYLADTRGGDPLFPRDPKRRADVVRWMSWELAHFGAELRDALFERLFKPYIGEQPVEERVRRAVQQFEPFAKRLDRHLEHQPFVAGHGITLADITLAIQPMLAPLTQIDLSRYPVMRDWLVRLEARPSFRASAPPPEATATAEARIAEKAGRAVAAP